MKENYPIMVKDDIYYYDAKQHHYYTWTKPCNFVKQVCKQYNIPREYFGDELDFNKLVDLYNDYCKKHKIKYRNVKRVCYNKIRKKPSLPEHLREEAMRRKYICLNNEFILNPYYSNSVEVA